MGGPVHSPGWQLNPAMLSTGVSSYIKSNQDHKQVFWLQYQLLNIIGADYAFLDQFYDGLLKIVNMYERVQRVSILKRPPLLVESVLKMLIFFQKQHHQQSPGLRRYSKI